MLYLFPNVNLYTAVFPNPETVTYLTRKSNGKLFMILLTTAKLWDYWNPPFYIWDLHMRNGQFPGWPNGWDVRLWHKQRPDEKEKCLISPKAVKLGCVQDILIEVMYQVGNWKAAPVLCFQIHGGLALGGKGWCYDLSLGVQKWCYCTVQEWC